MKTRLMSLMLLLLVLSCNRTRIHPDAGISIIEAKTLFLAQQKAFKNQNAYALIDSLPANLQWDKSFEMTIDGETCRVLHLGLLPGRTVRLSGRTYSGQIGQSLIFRRNKNGQLYFQVVQSWASSNLEYKLSMLILDQQGKLKGAFMANENRTVEAKVDFIKNAPSMSRSYSMSCTQTDFYSCLYYHDENYGCNYNYSTVTCTTSSDEQGDYYNGYEDDPGGGGSSGFNYGSIEGIKTRVWVYAAPEDKVITDFRKYIDCFTINTNSSYSVTLYVRQPIPNTRNLVSDQYGNAIPNSLDRNTRLTVGHTFIGFTQSVGGKILVNRTVGFYPFSAVSPINPDTKGVLVDNSLSSYDVSVTLSVTSTQFKTIMDKYYELSNNNYNLNSNNCTSIAIDALNASGLNIPKTIGEWPLGKGADPADLGQDLRSYNAPILKQKDVTGGTCGPNSAPCK